uniref:Uncharacterized protein n=1 Tax=Arundo donax TaxID=35708 RepID=A0A0A8ZNF1_ARUDO
MQVVSHLVLINLSILWSLGGTERWYLRYQKFTSKVIISCTSPRM